MSDPEFTKKQQAVLAPELTKAFANSSDDDPRVRQYLALALGRLQPPIPPDARRLLVEALNDKESQTRISAIWALGSTGDVTVAPDIEKMYASGDAGVRKMVVYALGSLPGDVGTDTLTKALEDEQPDVQWCGGAALAEAWPPERRADQAGSLEPPLRAAHCDARRGRAPRTTSIRSEK